MLEVEPAGQAGRFKLRYLDLLSICFTTRRRLQEIHSKSTHDKNRRNGVGA